VGLGFRVLVILDCLETASKTIFEKSKKETKNRKLLSEKREKEG
jgi:hypothetical protein